MKKLLTASIYIVSLILFISIVVCYIVPGREESKAYSNDIFPYDTSGWTYEDGGKVDIKNISFKDDKATIQYNLDHGVIGSEDLCFISTNVIFKMYVNDEMFFEFAPELGSFVGSSYGNKIQCITLPPFMDGDTLKIELTTLDPGMWSGFRYMGFGNGMNYIKKMTDENLWRLAVCLLIFVIGVVLTLISIFQKSDKSRTMEIAALGNISIVMSIWMSTNSYLLLFITNNSELIRILNYISLLFLPFAGMTLVTRLINSKLKVFNYIILGLTVINYGLHITLIPMGVCDFHDLLKLSEDAYKTKVMDKMAHTDSLTGMENRLAFNECEIALKHKKSGYAMFIQFDINFLKKVNDEYGHDSGDRFIRAGADSITTGFEKIGRVFRTGGDEFIVIMYDVNKNKLIKDFENGRKLMETYIDEYNASESSPIPLRIACGNAIADLSRDQIRDVEIEADRLMYINKAEIKKSEDIRR